MQIKRKVFFRLVLKLRLHGSSKSRKRTSLLLPVVFPRMAALKPASELLPDGVAWLGSWLKTGKTRHSLASCPCLVRGLWSKDTGNLFFMLTVVVHVAWGRRELPLSFIKTLLLYHSPNKQNKISCKYLKTK